MFKSVLLATTATLALGSAAFSADLPSRRAAPAPYVAVPVFTWTGFYIGGNAGYMFGDDNRITTSGNQAVTIGNVAVGARPASVRNDPEGFTGGGQIGYNLQFGNVVVGLEADAAYTDFQRNVRVIGTTGAASDFRTDMGFLGTVRGRLGYAWDRVLVYGTGGFAYADVDNSARFFATPAAGGLTVTQFFGRRSEIETGWTAGGGVEFALPTSFSLFGSNAVTFKAEALYYDLGRRNIIVADTGAAPVRGSSYTSRFDNNGVIARAGINFKFGSF
jgi:outer membrane immunogenic protein